MHILELNLLKNRYRYSFTQWNELTGLKFQENKITFVIGRGGHTQLFLESAIAIPQLEGSTSAIAFPQLFKEMLLRNRNSAIATFSEVRNFKSAT
jgi:hypothetical protein